jgi:hypothetical protein
VRIVLPLPPRVADGVQLGMSRIPFCPGDLATRTVSWSFGPRLLVLNFPLYVPAVFQRGDWRINLPKLDTVTLAAATPVNFTLRR